MDHNDYMKPEAQLCFPLYAVAREVVKKYTPDLDPLGLTYTQYITMMVLWKFKERTVKEIGSILYLDSGTLTPVLKKLEEKGLVTRKRSLADERNLIVRLTEKGAALEAKTKNIAAHMRERIPLSLEEQETVYTLLQKMLIAFAKED